MCDYKCCDILGCENFCSYCSSNCDNCRALNENKNEMKYYSNPTFEEPKTSEENSFDDMFKNTKSAEEAKKVFNEYVTKISSSYIKVLQKLNNT